MRKTITKSVTACDFCGEEVYPDSHCLRCKKHICYECAQTRSIKYTHSVHCSGSGDGEYCLECHAALMATPDPRFLAYLKIKELRAEAERFYKDYARRVDEAEANLKATQGAA